MNSIVYPGRFDSLEKISNYIEKVSISAGFDDMGVYAIKTAVDEACSNIIDHAYGGESVNEIELDYTITSNSLIITLRDHGKPFNPEHIHPPHKHHHLKHVKERGLGLYFMRQLMDEVHFNFTPGRGNTLTMVKHLPK